MSHEATSATPRRYEVALAWDPDDLEQDAERPVLWPRIKQHALKLLLIPLAAGIFALAGSYTIPPTYTAQTLVMPPQQSQSGAAAALASLGALANLTGASTSGRGSGDQYIALLQSATVSDRIIDAFDLIKAYDVDFRMDARTKLAKRVRFSLGKKDGLLQIQVDDTSPLRAAQIANHYITELRKVSSTLAVTEAQQRRAFFERQLSDSRDQLTAAQYALQGSGFNPDAMKAEPKAAADSYARLKAEVTSAEIKLQVLRGNLADGAPEVRQQQAAVQALRAELSRLEGASSGKTGSDYINRYREFKYRETLFEMYARQFELARLDESREGALIQVIDPAHPPERKSKPRRSMISAGAALAGLIICLGWIILRGNTESISAKPQGTTV